MKTEEVEKEVERSCEVFEGSKWTSGKKSGEKGKED